MSVGIGQAGDRKLSMEIIDKTEKISNAPGHESR